jgi:hypothetical protein
MEQVGELLLAPRAPGEVFSGADRRLFEDLTRQVAGAVHAVRLTQVFLANEKGLSRSLILVANPDGRGSEPALRFDRCVILVSRRQAASDSLGGALWQVWVQNFMVRDGRVVWRENHNAPPSGRYIGSPYDPAARYAVKRATRWTGYKVHLTETCDEDRPNLITNVETTPAAVADDAVTAQMHAHLAERQLLPAKHIADTGFVSSALFVSGRKTYGIELIGPTRGDNHWQAKAGAGFAARDFVIDWEHETATCPQGQTSASWTPAVDKFKNHVIKIKFGKTDCRDCPVSAQCTRSTPPRRTITVRPQAQHEARLAGRQREQTEDYKAEYARRAGVEGTIAQGVRSHEMRTSRYFGLPKTHLQHLMTAAAINVVRILRWLAGEPKAITQVSAFARLYQPVT